MQLFFIYVFMLHYCFILQIWLCQRNNEKIQGKNFTCYILCNV